MTNKEYTRKVNKKKSNYNFYKKTISFGCKVGRNELENIRTAGKREKSIQIIIELREIKQ